LSSQDALRQYVEDVALYFEQVGMTRSAGRILGWLLVAKPPHQSMTDIVDALQVSKSSVSTATRTLLQFGFIERISLPGIRQDYYRMTEGIWKNSIRQQSELASAIRDLADRGLEIIADQPAEQKERLQEMRDLYAFIEEEIPLILERWERKQQFDDT
jgi:DNA-binding transcriptional regulator GbsR (MarR family)